MKYLYGPYTVSCLADKGYLETMPRPTVSDVHATTAVISWEVRHKTVCLSLHCIALLADI